MNIATESICPKGWTLPTAAQTRTIGPNSGSTTYLSIFSPVLGGRYDNSALNHEDTSGYWWDSTAYSGVARYRLVYGDGNLYTNGGNGVRRYGQYIRCVQAS